MTERVHVSYAQVSYAAQLLARRWTGERLEGVYGVPRGGVVPAAIVAGLLDLQMVDEPGPDVLVVDDLVDSGATADRVLRSTCRAFDALYRKPTSPPLFAPAAIKVDGWVVFPWERGSDEEAGPTDAVRRLLQHIGEDPNREGLLDTPKRVVKAMAEMTVGYHDDPAAILSTVFEEQHDQMVVLEGIEFTSLCEHHLLPFVGTATVGYIPAGRVVGLSKLARIVECFARRLQVQERMTDQIAGAIQQELEPRGVGVVIRAHHSCMGCRGVRKPAALMTTSSLAGLIKDDPAARAEFLSFSR